MALLTIKHLQMVDIGENVFEAEIHPGLRGRPYFQVAQPSRNRLSIEVVAIDDNGNETGDRLTVSAKHRVFIRRFSHHGTYYQRVV